MKKSDLKNGMVVETRNGKRFLIVSNWGIGKDSCIKLNGLVGYDENLYDINGDSTYDITKIYISSGRTFKNLFDNERLSLIWEREEQPKLSELDKNDIKIGLKKIREECRKHYCCKDCDLTVNERCILTDNPDDLKVDKLFEE